MNKKWILNILIVLLVFFIVLSSIFIYKYITLKQDVKNNGQPVNLIYTVYKDDQNNFYYIETLENQQAGKTLGYFLSLDNRILISNGMICSIQGIGSCGSEGPWWMVYSDTHNACKNNVDYSCNSGINGMTLVGNQNFWFKLTS